MKLSSCEVAALGLAQAGKGEILLLVSVVLPKFFSIKTDLKQVFTLASAEACVGIMAIGQQCSSK